MEVLSKHDIEKMVGEFAHNYTAQDFQYEVVGQEGEREIILDILKRLEEDGWNSKSNEYWEQYWQKIFDKFVKSNYDTDVLAAEYFYYHTSLRYRNQFITPLSNEMQRDVTRLIVKYTVQAATAELDFDNIVELGCGSCHNLVQISKFCDAHPRGIDFTDASGKIALLLAEKHRLPIYYYKHDLFAPFDCLLPVIDSKSVVISVGGLEQLGENWSNMLDWIMAVKPVKIIHFEPMYELYDENNLLDYLAIKFHDKRNYLKGYLPALEQLEKDNKVEILRKKRTTFGTTFNDGWSILIWKPL